MPKITFETVGSGTAFTNEHKNLMTNLFASGIQLLAGSVLKPNQQMIRKWFGASNYHGAVFLQKNFFDYFTKRCTNVTVASAGVHKQNYIGYVYPNPLMGLRPGNASSISKDHHFININKAATASKKFTANETKRSYQMANGYLRVPSGIKVYFTPKFKAFDSSNEKAFGNHYKNCYILRCLFHEISHKVLWTDDHAYGYIKCVGLGEDGNVDGVGSETALYNADNWGFYMANLYYLAKTGRYQK